jgi:stearoyl-CoA desaturase (Delta-9 desaturase)
MATMIEVVPLLGAIAAVWLAIAQGLWALDLLLFTGLYLFTMAGVEMGFHRLVSHRQFGTVPALRALLLVGGSMAGEGTPMLWAAVHRLHHQHADGPDDPHSPVYGRRGLLGRLRGFVRVQFLWYTRVPAVARFRAMLRAYRRDGALPAGDDGRFLRAVADLLNDPLVDRIERRYGLWVLSGYALPTAVGALAAGPWGALHGLLWGGFARDFAVKQVTFAINSVGHTIGVRSAGAHAGASRNNAVMALFTLGAGWHANHHDDPGAAVLRFRWWQVDPVGVAIQGLARLGLAWNVCDRRKRDRDT